MRSTCRSVNDRRTSSGCCAILRRCANAFFARMLPSMRTTLAAAAAASASPSSTAPADHQLALLSRHCPYADIHLKMQHGPTVRARKRLGRDLHRRRATITLKYHMKGSTSTHNNKPAPGNNKVITHSVVCIQRVGEQARKARLHCAAFHSAPPLPCKLVTTHRGFNVRGGKCLTGCTRLQARLACGAAQAVQRLSVDLCLHLRHLQVLHLQVTLLC